MTAFFILVATSLTNSGSEDPPTSLRPSSVDANNQRSTTPRPESLQSPDHLSRPVSRQSDRRPIGPRSISPLPIPRSPESASELPYLSDDPVSESSPRASPEPQSTSTPSPVPTRHGGIPTPMPRSKRQPFQPTGNTEATPKASTSAAATSTSLPPGSSGVEPLSIKKKNSGRSSTVNNSPLARKINARNSPLSRPGNNRVVSPRRVSPQIKKTKHVSQSSASSVKTETLEHISQLALSTKEDVSLLFTLLISETNVASDRGI